MALEALQESVVAQVVLAPGLRQAPFALLERQLEKRAPREGHELLDDLPALFHRHAAVLFKLFFPEHPLILSVGWDGGELRAFRALHDSHGRHVRFIVHLAAGHYEVRVIDQD